MAIDGKLSRFLDIKTVEKTLLNIYIEPDSDNKLNELKNMIGRRKNVSK